MADDYEASGTWHSLTRAAEPIFQSRVRGLSRNISFTAQQIQDSVREEQAFRQALAAEYDAMRRSIQRDMERLLGLSTPIWIDPDLEVDIGL